MCFTNHHIHQTAQQNHPEMVQLKGKETLPGCQVGGHLEKGGKSGHFTGKGGQKEDIFSLKLIQQKQKSIKFTCKLSQVFN